MTDTDVQFAVQWDTGVFICKSALQPVGHKTTIAYYSIPAAGICFWYVEFQEDCVILSFQHVEIPLVIEQFIEYWALRMHFHSAINAWSTQQI